MAVYRRQLIALLLLLLAVCRADGAAAEYFIDSDAANDSANGTSTNTPWKRAPGMVNFAGSYSHANGDIFWFRGGKTWTNQWTIANSGALGSEDVYRSHRTWPSGTDAQAIFDGGGQNRAAGMIAATAKHNLKFIDLSIVNHGLTGDAGAGGPQALNFLECTNFTMMFCTNATYCQRMAYFHYDTAGRYKSPNFTSNDVSHVGSMLWEASSTANVYMDGLVMRKNRLHDGASQIGGTSPDGIHGDGLIHGFSVPNNTSSQYHTNFVIEGNICDGDWRRSFGNDGAMTAWIYFEDWCFGTIQNNIIAPNPVQASLAGSFINIGGSTPLDDCDVGIYNNTLINDGTSSASAGFLFAFQAAATSWTIDLRNNIMDGLTYAVWFEQTNGTVTTDYNCFRSGSGQLGWGTTGGGGVNGQTYAVWQGAGKDTHGVLGSDPLVVNAASDFHLQAGSPCVGAGIQLNSIFTIDYDGVTRGSTWDIGAFEYSAAAPPVTVDTYRALRWRNLRR